MSTTNFQPREAWACVDCRCSFRFYTHGNVVNERSNQLGKAFWIACPCKSGDAAHFCAVRSNHAKASRLGVIRRHAGRIVPVWAGLCRFVMIWIDLSSLNAIRAELGRLGPIQSVLNIVRAFRLMFMICLNKYS